MDRKYKHIFFDLDNTIWDFNSNSAETLGDLYSQYGLAERGIKDADHFVDKYLRINKEEWRAFRAGEISAEILRPRRFARTLQHFKIEDEELTKALSVDYIAQCPEKNQVDTTCA